MTKYHEHVFENEQVGLDDNEFTHCTFQNCTFLYKGGKLCFINNVADGCNFKFAGPASGTIKFLWALHKNTPEIVEAILDQIRSEDPLPSSD